eukprot:GFYU01005670.1.p1 GENE.GFYU01005670.1~~GFYU01005670.1.p1  ORF type:complete len:480 (+),score=157.57 GFYU01005670.1:116-1555(+)
MSTVEPGATVTVWVASVTICLSAFLFGYNTSCLNGPLASGKPGSLDFELDNFMKGLATAMTLLGAMLGAFGVNIPAEVYGRRLTLLGNNVFNITGAILSAFAPYLWVLIVARFILGVGVGVASVLVPMLISEIAPPSARGSLTTLNQLLVTMGIFAAQIIYFGFEQTDQGWRYTVGFAALPAALQLLLFATVPESPRWLASQDRVEDATEIIKRLRGPGANIRTELEEVQQAANASISNEDATWSEVLSYSKLMFIGIGSMAVQQLTGINAVMYYSTSIFGFAGLDGDSKTSATLGVTALNVVMTLVSVWLVDRAGRRPLLLWGLAIMFFSLIPFGVVLLAMDDGTAQGNVAIAAMMIYIVGFAIGLGAVLWPVLGEIFPQRVRSKGMSLCLFTNWMFNLILTLTLLSMIEGFGGGDDEASKKKGAAIVFLIFAGLSLVGFVFSWAMIPETKGKGLEEIQAMVLGKNSELLLSLTGNAA